MLLQPLLFLFVMGTGLGSIVDTGGGIDFKTFLFPGVLAMSVLFTAVFAGISLVWDREFGFLREMMVAPVSAAAIIFGKCLGGATVGHRAEPASCSRWPALVGVPYSPVLIVDADRLPVPRRRCSLTALGVAAVGPDQDDPGRDADDAAADHADDVPVRLAVPAGEPAGLARAC